MYSWRRVGNEHSRRNKKHKVKPDQQDESIERDGSYYHVTFLTITSSCSDSCIASICPPLSLFSQALTPFPTQCLSGLLSSPHITFHRPAPNSYSCTVMQSIFVVHVAFMQPRGPACLLSLNSTRRTPPCWASPAVVSAHRRQRRRRRASRTSAPRRDRGPCRRQRCR